MAIYHITCKDDPKHTYVGESKRPLGVRFKEHTKLDRPTGVGEHCLNIGPSVSITNTKVLERELNWHRRKVKKAIHIRQRCPTMNRDQGYQLPRSTTRSFRRCLSHFTRTPVCDQGLPKQVEMSSVSNTCSKVSTFYEVLSYHSALLKYRTLEHRIH